MSGRFLRVAVCWLLAGVLLGAWMGATLQFDDKPVHVHGNLLGWVSCGLFALIYRAWPALEAHRLAGAHFWLHTLGLAAMAAGLLLMVRGVAIWQPLVGAGSLAISLGTLLFTAMVWQATRLPASRTEALLHSRA